MHSLLRFAAVAAALLASGDAAAQRLANGRPASHRAIRDSAGQSAARPEPAPAEPRPAAPPEELPPAPHSELNPAEAAECDPLLGGPFLDRPIFGGRFGFPSFGIAPQPLVGASWLNRPLSAQAFTGVYYGDVLIEESVRQQADMFTGVRLGWDWNDRWGGETRLGFTQVGTEDIAGGAELADTDVVLWDLDVLYYPTGDTRLRPYFSFGLGVAHFEFEDAAGTAHQKELVGMPIAMGLKYRAKPWFAARLDLADNIALPNAGVRLQNNFSITLTAEVHFGGGRTSYWPWNPTLQTW